ncbi:hypothetical protein [Radicibacter daui]|uniref:hypothetical protein n=1 Tax=Radicibacter daui TaxID=3064829 RepID=UPI004046BC1F
MRGQPDNFAVLGIFLDAIGKVLGPFSAVERATRRAMFTTDGTDLTEAQREFARLSPKLRRQVGHQAEVKARDVVERVDRKLAATSRAEENAARPQRVMTPPPQVPGDVLRTRRVAPKPAAVKPMTRPR